jgi:hypothetical protein
LLSAARSRDGDRGRLPHDPHNHQRIFSFDILHFLKWSRNAVEKAYVLDEVQLQMSPREWFDTQHKVFNTFCDIQ